jgi:hypothetical protein
VAIVNGHFGPSVLGEHASPTQKLFKDDQVQIEVLLSAFEHSDRKIFFRTG